MVAMRGQSVLGTRLGFSSWSMGRSHLVATMLLKRWPLVVEPSLLEVTVEFRRVFSSSLVKASARYSSSMVLGGTGVISSLPCCRKCGNPWLNYGPRG